MVKSENVLKVINKFKSILDLNPQLDMKECLVNYRNACGTPHCHAGWYAIASKSKFRRRFMPETNFTEGVKIMAADLRFMGLFAERAMREFFADNPSIWGNEYGGSMFSEKVAFKCTYTDKRQFGAESIKDIIDHWQDVYDRLVILEKKNSVEISNPPITAEKLINELEGKAIKV